MDCLDWRKRNADDVPAHPLLPADNRSVRQDLLVHRTVQFDEEMTTYEFFTQHPLILYTRLCETVMVDVALRVTFMSVNQTFAIPTSVLLKNDLPFVLGVN
jgi:hypothetical protein